ncbi:MULTISPECIES: MazG nucleotide pyrophosphohydrolase domain-containing protein [Methanohalophilus]|jgi:NTP pyrophosphatase (non-canonical NTP hydrolase)|uniref:NTP pyrophosphatase (Non-canonical NTP hydrolase) n=1 Tax=Methanohalophilus euhalobius TaxID=51203 RepID=A0A285F7M0_9EURY|nr:MULTISPECIES: MazG nucleotide pyrophosphohydrolase domain-containing protein [Methanohalophilus]KXS42513.1 MAG: MazG nucleotide pyrophosphohydrolase [Methanohalophilus sp. T328-1]RSD36134.1 MAG: MazG nucleotide pyrophosphohydrolase [Methanohalophilus sp.]OBZ35005.1 MAG: nucleotide pyrophosphohydrolase [Methanohalophilus sp. DAL1]OBZ35724.1 MAG: nucleotide pyrophosphohydrolase [Methanohalophilus sp. DAL1]ODV50100.1 MAG: MazG nucleotide pyrophosphohydrolase [Methanohalophilus sp. 2-GBenrich]
MEIAAFQQLMCDLYLENDKRRGKTATALWLVEEVGELAEAIRRDDPESIREELADCFAWIGALANLYGIDLEEVFNEKYPQSCPTCGKNPCICTD